MRRASEMKWVKGMTQIGLRGMGTSKSKDFSDAKKWGSKIITDQKLKGRVFILGWVSNMKYWFKKSNFHSWKISFEHNIVLI